MTDDPYVYPGTTVLRNKLGITDATELERVERLLTTQRAAAGVPTGDFDLTHLQAIHRHLLSGLYDWAGEIRTVEITKGGHQFMFRQYIGNGMTDVHRRIVAADYFKGATGAAFAEEAGRIIGDVNYVHPFREGNGRTQLLYLQQLSGTAGHPLVLRHIDANAWLDASRRAHDADYAPMGRAIREALERSEGRKEPPSEDRAGDYIRDLLAEAEREKSDNSDGPEQEKGRTPDRGRDR